MASITSAGIGSGLDIGNLVSQLVAAEGQPTQLRIARGEAAAQSKLSAYGTLKATLANFRDQLAGMRELDDFLARKATSASDDVYTVSATSTAVPADYAVEVVNLASAERLTSGAFAAADTAVGTGNLTISIGGEAFLLAITSENNTLAGIRDAINDSPDNKGVQATIVNAAAGSYLILSGEKTGAAQSITVTQSGGDGGLAALEYDPGNGLNALTQVTAAADALLRIDGLDVTSATNSVSNAIDGVTIDLVAADPGSTHKLTVSNDTAAVRKKIDAFVASYNGIVTTFQQLSAFDAEAGKAGPLLGDASLRGIRDQLRREMSVGLAQAGLTYDTLRSIGIEIEVNGKMKVVGEDLDAALADDFAAVGRVFAADGGYAGRLHDMLDSFLDDDGVLTARTEGLNRTIDNYSEQRERLNERLESLEARLLRQFTALDSLVAQLSSTSNFLAQQLANLPGVDRNNS